MHDKPRERIIRVGPQALSDAELLALILTAGTRGSNVMELAHRVSSYLSYQRHTPTVTELQQIRGIGKAKACLIVAHLELCRRFQNADTSAQQPVASSAREIYRLYRGMFRNAFSEEFYALYLDTKLCVVACEQLFVGTLDSVTVHPREVFHRAIKHLAHSVVIMHNHPSGDPAPSPQDIAVTQTMQDVGTIVGIPLIDHIIFGAEGFWSWNDADAGNGPARPGSREPHTLSEKSKSES